MPGLSYPRGDCLPAWEPDLALDSDTDFATGWTFALTFTRNGEVASQDPLIVGGLNLISVSWKPGDLDQEEGDWLAELKATRTEDSRPLTIRQQIQITPRDGAA